MTDIDPAASPLAQRARAIALDLREISASTDLLAESAQSIADGLSAEPPPPPPPPPPPVDPPPIDPDPDPDPPSVIGVVTEVAADLTPVLTSHAGIAANWFTNVGLEAVVVDLSGFRLMPGAEPKPSIPVDGHLLVVAGQPWEASTGKPAIVHRVDVFGPPAPPPAPAPAFNLIGGMSYGGGPRSLTGSTDSPMVLTVSAVASQDTLPGERVASTLRFDSVATPQFDVFLDQIEDRHLTVGAAKHVQSAFAVGVDAVAIGEFATGSSPVAEAVAPSGSGECMIVVAMGGAATTPGKISDAWTRVGGTGPGWVSVFVARGPAAEGETVRVPLSASDAWSAFIVRAL